MAINPATLAAEAELNAFLTTITDSQTRAITGAWVEAWDSVVRELEAATSELVMATTTDTVTRDQILRSSRASVALESTKAALDSAALSTQQVITADLSAAIKKAAGVEETMIASQLTGVKRETLAANLIRADSNQIAAMIARSTQQIMSLSLPLAPQTYATVKAELLRGITVGANPRTAALRMISRAEDKFDIGLNRALTISRTEMLDATRQAAYVTDQANKDVLAGWVWLAHLDYLTCPACVSEHGELHPVEELGPLDHQNGRCARVPKTKTWKELGFDGISDPPDMVKSADDWFDGLSAVRQKGILGDKGFAAWKEGRFPRSMWSMRRTTDGWRDSYAPRRPPGPGVTFKADPRDV